MQIAYEVNEHHEVGFLFFVRQTALTEHFGDVGYSLYHVARRIGGCRFVGFALVDVLVVPRLCIGIFMSVAGIVEPIGVIDRRVVVENSFNASADICRKVLFGNESYHIVPLLPPCKARKSSAGGCK